MKARVLEADACRLGILCAAVTRHPARARGAAVPIQQTGLPRIQSKMGRLPNSAILFDDVVYALSLKLWLKACVRTFMPPTELARASWRPEATRGGSFHS